jgi:hypothetical protein
VNGIRLIRLLEVLPVTAARNADGVYPRSVVITSNGELKAVDQVLFNGMASPSFAVFSANQLIAQVPDVLDEAIITDVMVLSSVASMTQRSLIEFGVGTRIARQSGVQRLIQNFVRLLLRSTGSNIFHKTLGGSLGGSVGHNVTSRVAADVAIAIASVRQQIIAAQTPHSNIPAAERLLSAEIAGLTEDPANASIYCTVVVTTHDRQRSAATLVA